MGRCPPPCLSEARGAEPLRSGLAAVAGARVGLTGFSFLVKPMNQRHIYLTRNALKLPYGNLGSKICFGGETPGPPP